MEYINWGSIGCGDVMEVKSGPALQNVEFSTLQAVMRRNGVLAKDFAHRHDVPKWYDSAEALIFDPDINAIYISTPPDSHLYYTKLAAQAGKAIYVEKPMANSYAQCVEMIEVCITHNVPLFVAYYRRALPRFLKVKEIIDSGSLGTIQGVNVQLQERAKELDIKGQDNWRVHPEIAGCGYFCDLASHIFDLLQFLLGEIISASGSCSNTGDFYEAEDYVNATFQFKSGISGAGLWDFNARKDLEQTEIIGSKGSVTYAHFTEEPVVLNLLSGVDHFDIPNPKFIQQDLIQSVVNDLRGVGKCPSTGISAAKTNWVLDQVLGR